MTLNKKTLGGGYLYDTPLVTTLEFQSEGVLCGSYKWNEGGPGNYTDGDINDNGEY